MKSKRFHLLLLLLALSLLALPFRAQIRHAVRIAVKRKHTVSQRLHQYGPAARARMLPYYQRAGVLYPPARLTLVALKHEMELQVYATGKEGKMRLIRRYPIQGASGDLGPKLHEGDCQVPEGLYRIDGLNPDSAYRVSLHINYPNAFDRRMGKADGRAHLGGDIMIHGGSASVGCLAMGDPASEELFVQVADTGISHTDLILSPLDFRAAQHSSLPDEPVWVQGLYERIRCELAKLPKPTAQNCPHSGR